MFSSVQTLEATDYQDICTEIVPGSLYLSGYRVANDLNRLQELSIVRVVRLGDKNELREYETHAGVEYHTIEIKDSVRSHFTQTMLDNAIDFITSASTPVLIHCFAGVSRSAAVAMAYLIRVCGKSYREARTEIEEKRACVSPNTTFLKVLQAYATSFQSRVDNCI